MPEHRDIAEKLRKFGGRKKRVTAERGLSVVLAVLCVALLLAVVGDRMLFLSPGARLAILVSLALAFMLSVAGMVVAPMLSRIGTRRLAMGVQDRFPELGDRVLTAIELSARPAGDPASEALVQAVVADAEAAAGNTNFNKACDARPLVRAVLALCAVCLLAAGYVVAHPLPFASCMLRLLDPYGGHRVYTYTELDLSPRGGLVARGESVTIDARVSGAVPDAATFYLRRGPGSWKRLSIPHQGAGSFRFLVEEVHETTSYSVRAGDAHTPVYQVNPIDRPEVVKVTVVCTYPAYTRLTPRTFENPTGGFSVLKGGSYRLSVGTSRRVASVKMIGGGTDISFRPAAGGGWDSGEVRPEENATIEIFVEDGAGIGGAQPARYRVTVTRDEAPAVTVEQPESDLAVMPDEVIRIQAIASDDFGLITLEMPFAVVPGKGRVGRKLLKASLDELKDLDIEYDWKIADHGVEPGDRIEFVVEASDNAEPRAQSSRSRTYSILVISRAEHLDRLIRRQENIAMRLGRMLRRQIEETDNTEAISLLNDEQIATDEASRKASYGSEVQDGLSKEAVDVTQDMSRLLQEMRKNPLVEEGSMVEVASVGKALGELSSGDMNRAAEKLLEGSLAKSPGNRRQALRGASRTQYGVSERLRELLERIRKDTETSRLAGLRERLRELAKGERTLMGDVGTVAPRTAGRTAEEIPDGDKIVVDSLAERQERLLNGMADVLASMEKAITQLSFVKSDLAEKVKKARTFVIDKDVSGRMSKLRKQIADNKLFTCTASGEGIAKDLEEAADMLKTQTHPWDELLTPSELENLISRQKELQQKLSELMKKAETDEGLKKALEELKKAQQELAEELAKALEKARQMNRQLLGAMEDTAKNMSSALGSMGNAGAAMGQGEAKQGEAEQKNAIESLTKALESMKSLLAAGLEKYRKMSEAVQKLRKILGAQKEVARETQRFREKHGEGPHRDAQGLALEPFAGSQQEIETETKQLAKDWPSFLGGAKTLEDSAGEMGKSSELMGAGRTNEPVREAQQKAIALLEAMMSEGASGMKGMGQAGMSLEMLLMLLGSPGMGGQGYDGGTIVFVPEKQLDIGERDWAKLAPRIRKRVLQGWNRNYPPEYRELMEMYFERIRRN